MANISFNINPDNHKKSGVGHRRLSKITNTPTSTQEKVPNIKKIGTRLPKFNEDYTPLVSQILNEMGIYPGCDIKKSPSLNSISKKHDISVKRLESQLKKGIKVEMEHTTDPGEAKIIALQHIEEIPNYYDKLNKMEKGSIKEDKDPCWSGYKKRGMKKKGKRMVPNCVLVKEATRLPMQTGTLLKILINWRGQHLLTQMFFPQLSIPKRDDITYAVNKVYPDARVVKYNITEINSNIPIIQVSDVR